MARSVGDSKGNRGKKGKNREGGLHQHFLSHAAQVAGAALDEEMEPNKAHHAKTFSRSAEKNQMKIGEFRGKKEKVTGKRSMHGSKQVLAAC